MITRARCDVLPYARCATLSPQRAFDMSLRYAAFVITPFRSPPSYLRFTLLPYARDKRLFCGLIDIPPQTATLLMPIAI